MPAGTSHLKPSSRQMSGRRSQRAAKQGLARSTPTTPTSRWTCQSATKQVAYRRSISPSGQVASRSGAAKLSITLRTIKYPTSRARSESGSYPRDSTVRQWQLPRPSRSSKRLVVAHRCDDRRRQQRDGSTESSDIHGTSFELGREGQLEQRCLEQ